MNQAGGSPNPSQARREFLRRVLKKAAYVPPAIAVMSMRNLAYAQATPPAHHHHHHHQP